MCSPEMIYALFDSLLFDLPDFKATVIPLEKPEIFPKQWILKCKHTHTRGEPQPAAFSAGLCFIPLPPFLPCLGRSLPPEHLTSQTPASRRALTSFASPERQMFGSTGVRDVAIPQLCSRAIDLPLQKSRSSSFWSSLPFEHLVQHFVSRGNSALLDVNPAAVGCQHPGLLAASN